MNGSSLAKMIGEQNEGGGFRWGWCELGLVVGCQQSLRGLFPHWSKVLGFVVMQAILRSLGA